MKYNKQNNYKIIFLIALIPFGVALNFSFTSPIKKIETYDINSSITKKVKYHSSLKNRKLTFHLKGYENKFVINSIVLKNVNISKIESFANYYKKVKIKILKPKHRSIGDKMKLHLYDKIDIVELEINNEKFLDLKTYNDSINNNNIGSSILFSFFGIIILLLGILERNYRKKKIASH